MAICSSTAAWEIHGQRNLVGYSPWGCKRVSHDLATKEKQYIPAALSRVLDMGWGQGEVWNIESKLCKWSGS